MRILSVLLLGFLICLSTVTAIAMSVKSDAAPSESTIPVDYTCDGKDISPQITWLGAPGKTQSFALIVSDPDAPSGTYYHWVVFNIPQNVTQLTAGINTMPPGAIAGQNSEGKTGYMGPCPPKGAAPHHYIFTVYALDKKLDLPSHADAKAVIDAMKSDILQQASYMMVYGRKAS